MERLKHKLLYAAFGASSGLTGIASFSRCSGNACTSCFGCAGVGIGVLLLALVNKFKKTNEGDNNGMA